jgi:catechol 2,3-dioxygenase-like lactoylglutathione lyase family enzyme
MSTLLSHVELNVSDYARSIRFYDAVLVPLGWRRLVVSAPGCCADGCWPNTIESDFDPYAEI